jgi:hypothetical protein
MAYNLPETGGDAMSVEELSLERFGLLSVEKVARMKGRDVRAVQRWIAGGLIPAVVISSGNRAVYLIPRKAAERFVTPARGRPRKDAG